LHDSEAALAWLKDHAAGLDADPAAITVMGVSAGGHLALFAGLAMTVSGEARAPLAAGVISLGGPADLRAMHAVRPGMIEGLLASDAHRGFDDAAGAASPCSYVVPGAAPVLLLHGISDPAVPFGAALAYLSALLGAHVPAWLLTHPGGHLVNGASPALRGELMAAQIDFVQRRRLDRSPGRHDLGGS
jgi:acetyl esterase/lipase